MSKGMDWGRARLQGRRILDHRYEFSKFRVRDRADRWLQAVERRLQEQRTVTASSSQ